MKKLICVFLSVILIIGLSVPALSSVAAANSSTPVIYIRGRGTDLFDDPYSDSRKQIYPLSYDKEYIVNEAKEILPILAKAVATRDWSDYCDALYDSVAPVFEDIVLDENGETKDNSGIDWKWKDSLRDVGRNGQYSLFGYVFRYDWRLDPCQCADELNEYVEAIKEVTGHSKVSIVSRCYATNIVLAYLTKYGNASVETCVFYCPTINGVDSCGEPFSGKLALDGDAIDRYAQQALGDDYLNELIKATVSLLNQNYKLDLAAALIYDIYKNVRANIVPRLLLATFATMPSYWSMIGDADYEDAKALVFGAETEKYAGLIAKIDNYHYNVQLKANETIKRCTDAGMHIGLVCKYGLQVVPIIENSDIVSDNTISIYSQSFGATSVKVDEALSDAYIGGRENAGYGRYISPDRQIDSSTGLYPDSTWYIKYLNHLDFPDCVDELLMAIVCYDGQLTVNDDERFPQYLVYDEAAGTITPMTGENMGELPQADNIFVAYWKFLKALFAYIKDYLNTLTNKQ